jgi:hypothetical protein
MMIEEKILRVVLPTDVDHKVTLELRLIASAKDFEVFADESLQQRDGEDVVGVKRTVVGDYAEGEIPFHFMPLLIIWNYR